MAWFIEECNTNELGINNHSYTTRISGKIFSQKKLTLVSWIIYY